MPRGGAISKISFSARTTCPTHEPLGADIVMAKTSTLKGGPPLRDFSRSMTLRVIRVGSTHSRRARHVRFASKATVADQNVIRR